MFQFRFRDRHTSMERTPNRREVLGGLTAAAAMSASGQGADGGMPRRALGRTGEKVSMIGLGGSDIGKKTLTDSQSVDLIRRAIDGGINFMDNCWDYHDGRSERLMGQALRDGYRQKVYLMTKIDGRTKGAAAKQIDESLRRLQTDHLDLLQHHEIIRYEDPHRIFGPGGAMEACLEAQKAGKVRHIGFTGHKDPHIHLYMLEVAKKNGFQFDSVQMPLNVMDAHFRSFEKLVLPELVKRNIAVLGMKSMGGGVILKSNAVKAVECLRYALSLPTSVVITGIESIPILEQAFEVGRTFQPLSEQERASLLERTRQAAGEGQFELFKTSAVFDGTAKHPEWLGDDLPRSKQMLGEG